MASTPEDRRRIDQIIPKGDVEKGKFPKKLDPLALVTRGAEVDRRNQQMDPDEIAQTVLRYTVEVARDATDGSLDIPKEELNAAQALNALRTKQKKTVSLGLAQQANRVALQHTDNPRRKDRLSSVLPAREGRSDRSTR